ncbi:MULTISPECIES: nitroreductase family protein [Clostridia]|uniref:nitroreductase family protein n=1 Tax=Clostridia TaxID=186801 RepID=UPI001F086F2D|nr:MULTISPECIES: nitroreductase family protein [Clostridia]MCH1937509.1 nitroreductase [Enterocloster sp. OA11]
MDINKKIDINKEMDAQEAADLYKVMEARHAVRSYQDKKIARETEKQLREEIRTCNREGGLSIQLILNDKAAFNGLMARFGGFRGVSNYIALVGPDNDCSEEKLGYYGERIALKAQQLGLNTCWVAATYKKGKCSAAVGNHEKMAGVLALGYGTTQGAPHRSKEMEQLCKADRDMPQWFVSGMKAAMLAPTAMNKQDFLIELRGDDVAFQVKDDKYGRINMGIIKYHFHLGAALAGRP